MGKEIERKFLIKQIPGNLESYPFHELEQGYLNTAPVVRVRKEDEEYYLTYKGKGFLEREEYNLPLTKEAYYHLILKADGKLIHKKRYLIPFENHTIELDVFSSPVNDLLLAEVEFESVEDAKSFVPPEWFGEEVTGDHRYSNFYLSQPD